ncbi:hypothetical protein ASPBRDRAFT_670667 [Aspergillus brasiliensis CBS 101740]|uniref:Uncharacterized protein n=1 Tax=Aspergillus brasiliensis (strain CBS 101740 / IMI 381727 / IBT 21946) TaxID=767769 RepID=A0A1L9UP00_ASPBC|nr:hypothetical protein ASPBRDRAFT_670667 [Aspergillus brasiliensis CBS 101740]
MSATIQTRVVPLDQLIPLVTKKDIEILTPRIYQQSNTVTSTQLYDWAHDDEDDDSNPDDHQFALLFQDLSSYQPDDDSSSPEILSIFVDPIPSTVKTPPSLITGPITSTVKIVLPRKNWIVGREWPKYERILDTSHSSTLQSLMRTVYMKLDEVREEARARGVKIRFPSGMPSTKYVIGRQIYRSRPVGQVAVGPMGKEVPVISYSAWYEAQTWDEFVAEVLSVMLGHLTRNIRIRIRNQRLQQDQEVFVVGFYGPQIYIARGYFPVETINRVHDKGCADDEQFELLFTRGYDPFRKEDWVEAMRALSRLFRYLVSGRAKVGVIQKVLAETDTTVEKEN